MEFRIIWEKLTFSSIQLTDIIAHRAARSLERQGLLERDAGHTYLTAILSNFFIL